MSKSNSDDSNQFSVEVGDLFNETDDDKDQRVVEIFNEKDPPTVLCHPIKRECESSDTEQKCVQDYVEK